MSESRSRTRERASRSHRGLTCTNCRIRKTRCDGTQPGCKTCEVYNDECRYEKPPPMSQIIAMAKRLQESEKTVVELRRALDGSSDGRVSTLGRSSPSGPSSRDTQDPSPPLTISDRLAEESCAATLVGDEDGRAQDGLLSDLSLDENGKFCYYGPTSAVHAPPALESQPGDSDEQSSKSNARSLLTSNALESRTWESFALGNAAAQTDIPRHIITKLLQIHWAWIAPMFMWVYRPAFMRDMATGGPYYSPFLLTVMCAHASRYDPKGAGNALAFRARLLMGTEINRPGSIPTVQALLQLSARDLAYGLFSQAWLYSGMAFRMVSDLGLHHSTAKVVMLGHLSAEDVEIRRRLFWSCYFWDKAISLYLGRMPVLRELPFNRSPELLDDSAEHNYWAPYYGDSVNPHQVPMDYPPTKSHVISCFENSCKLAVILNDIILNLYSRRASTRADETLRGIRKRLDEWRENSPPHLKYDPEKLPDICPPTHILCQNLLYYTTVILLHRPFYSIPAHHAACRKAADSIEKFVQLLEKTFGLTRITYVMAYCIYTAAAVMMQDVKMGDFEASIKIQTFLHALQEGIATCPILQRSINIITNGLRSDPVHIVNSPANNNAAIESQVARNYLPAFPYCDPDIPSFATDFNAGAGAGMDLDGFSTLDNFPENNFDMLGARGEWFFTP